MICELRTDLYGTEPINKEVCKETYTGVNNCYDLG